MKERKGIYLNFDSLGKLINPNQVKIIKNLENRSQMNYSQIQRKLNISLKETRRHSQKLINAGIVNKEPHPLDKGHPVFLSLKRKK